MTWALTIVGVAVLAVSAVSRRLSSTPVTPAMVFVVIGVLVGPLFLDDLSVSPRSSLVRTLAEATLALVLFSDASRINVRTLRRESSIPVRLLGVGLPLTIVLGSLLAAVLFGHLSVTEAVIIGVILAPTDAGLGQAVVTDRRLPQRIRQSLNVESGLNDGICVPILVISLAVAASSSAHPAHVVLEEIGWGVVAGAGAGVAAAAIVKLAGGRSLIEGSWRQLIPVAAATLAYGTAAGLGGSGFIAAFVAGMVFGGLVGGDTGEITIFAEEAGALLDGVTFLFFGAVLLGPALEHVTWQMALYAVLSLTVIRMLPVALALWDTKARTPTVALMGWLGPRGLASIVFAVIVEDAQLVHTSTIIETTYLTIGLSVLLHGLSAAPLVDRYARWYHGESDDVTPSMESKPASEFRTRGPVPHAAIAPAATR
ncbi:MAG: cation:proton antiporter [Solirubrobacteraceae bacterium]